VGYAGADNGWYDLNTMSSDEQVIPHRNTGDWQLDFARLHLHQWLPTDGIVGNTWNWLYNAIFSANLAIEQLENAKAAPAKIAEAKVLRAFFYYLCEYWVKRYNGIMQLLMLQKYVPSMH
jgi:hypothetical protein